MSDVLLRSVALRTVGDSARAIIGYCIGLALLVIMMGVFWPTIRDQSADFQQLIDSYPPAMQAFFGDFQDFTTPAGYLNAELFSLMLPLVLLIFVIGRSAATLAGEEERGVLDTLLAHPVSRRRVYLEKAAGIAIGVAMVVTVVGLGLVVIDLTFGMELGIGAIAFACFMLLLLAFAHGGVTFALAGWRGRSAFVIGLSSTFALASWLLASFGDLVEAMRPFRALSTFAHYSDVNALKGEWEGLAVLVLIAVGILGLLIGLWAFERRDLAV